MTNSDRDVERLLPLLPAMFHILIALGDGEKHGYAVMQDVARRTDGKVRMSPGTLYGSLRKGGQASECGRIGPGPARPHPAKGSSRTRPAHRLPYL